MPIHLAKPIKSASFSFSIVPDGPDAAPQHAVPIEIETNCAFMPMVFDAESGSWSRDAPRRWVGAPVEESPAVASVHQHIKG